MQCKINKKIDISNINIIDIFKADPSSTNFHKKYPMLKFSLLRVIDLLKCSNDFISKCARAVEDITRIDEQYNISRTSIMSENDFNAIIEIENTDIYKSAVYARSQMNGFKDASKYTSRAIFAPIDNINIAGIGTELMNKFYEVVNAVYETTILPDCDSDNIEMIVTNFIDEQKSNISGCNELFKHLKSAAKKIGDKFPKYYKDSKCNANYNILETMASDIKQDFESADPDTKKKKRKIVMQLSIFMRDLNNKMNGQNIQLPAALKNAFSSAQERFNNNLKEIIEFSEAKN